MTSQEVRPRDAVASWQQAYSDLEWASNRDELRQKFIGEFIVIHAKTVVAHACDRREALRQAMLAGYRRRELVVVPMLAQELEIPLDNV